MNNQAAFVLFLGLTVALAGFWYFTSYAEWNEEMDLIRNEIKKIENELSESDEIEKKLGEAQVEFKKIRAEYDEMVRMVNKHLDIPALIKQVELKSQEAKVTLNSIKFNPMIESPDSVKIPVTIDIEGTYHKIGKFMAILENLHLMNVNGGTVSFSPKGKVTRLRNDPKKAEQDMGSSIKVEAYAFHEKD